MISTRSELGTLLKSMGLNGIGAEVGVAFGENAEKLLETSDLKRLLLIDPWNYVPGQDRLGYGDVVKDWTGCLNYCRKLLQRFNARTTYMRMSSSDAAKMMEDGSLDFVYIDGNHMSPYIDEDLSLWYPKVKSGGVFAGHDFYDVDTAETRCDVKTAVTKFFDGKHEIVLLPEADSSWIVFK